MKSKLIFIILSVLTITGLLIYTGLQVAENKYSNFERGGYILSNEKTEMNKTETVKYYFEPKAKYKNNNLGSVSFKDVDGKAVKVDDSSFVHFNDNSVSVLKKSVIFNFDEIKNKNPKYYNVFQGSLLDNVNGIYYVDNLGKKIKFTNFMIKTNDNKYLIISKNIGLKLSEDVNTTVNDYIELSFVDEGIVKLQNQEKTYQTIAADARITIGEDIVLDLNNNYFYYKEEPVVSLNQVVIDSNDNIQIKPIEEEKEEEKEDTENGDGTGGGTGTEGNEGNAGGTGNNGGIIDGSTDEEIEENKFNVPNASVEEFTVSSNKVDASIKINDKDGVISSSTVTTITEVATSKVVYLRETEPGTYNIDVSIENLNPETNYNLTTVVTYKKNDIEYRLEVVSKTFITESLGISIEKDYFTTDSLSLNLKIDAYSKIKNADISLMTSTGILIKTISVSGEDGKKPEGFNVLFDGLKSNTKYNVKVHDILYNDLIISENYEIENAYRTLRVRPILGKLSYLIDKKNGTFILKMNNATDPDNGIESYRYEIYDARTIDQTSEPITVIEKPNNGSIDLPIDGTTIERGVPYVYKVIAEFYDNEKYIGYSTGYSDPFKMDGVEFPSVAFNKENITFERITGTIAITDLGSTINLDKPMTIVYTNSLGISNSFTTSGNLTIPFSVNNLRANETYTISIYASVNLQDGNDTIDNCFIGSAIIKTEETNPFSAIMILVNDETQKAFQVRSNLTSFAGVSTDLESDTLTGITFNLYSGTSTAGKLVKSIKQVDRDLRQYYSDLKNTYYEKNFYLNPEFFGLKNSDLTEEYYTIEITGAHDYTDYKNDIPIKNGVITIKSNGFIPDLPTDTENSIEFLAIRNKDAGDKYRHDLDAQTIVGYNIKANYDNSKKYAKRIKYYLHDAKTGVKIEKYTTDYIIPDTGELGYQTFWLDDGTPFGTVDTDFRRGNSYFFSYEAWLDLNFDGQAETKYPYSPDTILRSLEIQPEKQEAKMVMYPSISTGDTVTYKYNYKDVDHALYEEKLYADIDDNNKSDTSIILSKEDDFSEAVFTNMSDGYLKIYSKQALYKKSEEEIKDRKYVYHYYETKKTIKQLKYHVDLEVNRVIISILDYANQTDTINRIAGLEVTFTCGADTVVKKYLQLNGDNVVVDLSDIADFKNKDVKVSVKAIYDNGIIGFENNSSGKTFALQTNKDAYGGGDYLTITSSGNFTGYNQANGSIYTQTNGGGIVLYNVISSRTARIPANYTEGGLMYNYEYLQLKELEKMSLISDGSETITFDTIIPGVSLKADAGYQDIIPTLIGASLKIQVSGFQDVLENNNIFLELYEVSADGVDMKLIQNNTYTIEELKERITLSNLLPKTQYAIKLYGNIFNGTNFVKKQLYDLDFQSANKIYYFSTLSKVAITDVTAFYKAKSYKEKYITLNYGVDRIVGYDKIKYQLYKYVEDENGDLVREPMQTTIPDSTTFQKYMNITIPSNPGSEFEFNEKYSIDILPIVTVTIDGIKKDIELETYSHDFKLNALRSPIIGVSSSIPVKDSIIFKVNIYDIDRVIVDGEYTVEFYDPNGLNITPGEYDGVKFNISSLNKNFTLTNLQEGKTYKMLIKTYNDMQNNITSSMEYTKEFKATSLNFYGVDVGDIYTSQNVDYRNKIDLSFYNSYKLTNIQQIRYSIYGGDGAAQDNIATFTPVLKTAGGGSFYFVTLPETLPSSGKYYVQIQFLINGVIVSERTLEHIYVG